jgi:hypothetical protein
VHRTGRGLRDYSPGADAQNLVTETYAQGGSVWVIEGLDGQRRDILRRVRGPGTGRDDVSVERA